MSDGIAEVETHRIGAMFLADGVEPFTDQVERLFPARRNKFSIALDQRRLDQVRIIMQLCPGVTLGANETLAEWIVMVAADADESFGTRIRLDQQTAISLADRAHAGMDGDIRRGFMTQFASRRYMVHVAFSWIRWILKFFSNRTSVG